MPERRGDGIVMVICTGSGPITVTVGKDGAPVEEADSSCPWGTHGHAVAVLPEPIRDSRPAAYTDNPTRPLATLWTSRAPLAHNATRGPPATL